MKNKSRKLVLKLKHYYKRKSIQFVISISFSILAVIGMGFMGLALYNRFVSSTEEMMIENNNQLIDQINLNLNKYLRNMMGILDSIYFSGIKKIDLEAESLDEEMNLLYEANKDYLISIACFSEDGTIVGATPISNLKQNLDVTTQNWFMQANDEIENLHFSTPHVQNLFENNSFGYHWVVSLSRVVELTKGGTISRGILLVDMNFSGIEQLFKKINENQSGFVYLMDSNGEIIYHPRQKLVYSNLVIENNKVAATYEDGVHEEIFNFQDRIVTIKTVGYTGWKIVSVIPTSEFTMNFNQMKFFAGIIVAFTSILMLFGNMIVSHIIANPIKKLESSVKDLEYGNLNLDIYVGGSYEIQHLGRTIISVVSQMRNLMDEIVIEQEAKRKSELDALQSQINPHFLYNTLDSIVWMVESEKYKDAISMVTALANLFRISISKGKTIITIRDEIEHARSYLAIQKVRYKNRFDIQVDIDSQINECSTIKLIVQPLLENAIYHGVGFMDDDGEIVVKGYAQNQDIYIDVIDNGPGMTESVVRDLLTDDTRIHAKGSGIGIRNVHQRIQLYYGRDYGLKIDSEPDVGTKITIHLPKVYYDKKTKEESNDKKS